MDAIETVVQAMVSGAGAVAKDIASDAAKKAYAYLKQIFVKSATSPDGHSNSNIGKDISLEPVELRRQIEALDHNVLLEAVVRAEKVLTLLKPSVEQIGYSLNIQGNVQTVVQGKNPKVTIVQQDLLPKRKKKMRP
jgi:hypothetical protein